MFFDSGRTLVGKTKTEFFMNRTLKILITFSVLLCQLLPGSEAVRQVYKPDISDVEVEILSPVSRGKQNYQGLSAAESAMVAKGVTKARFSFPIKIPVDLCSREDLGLFLGVIYDQDRVFFNGELIGITADPENVSLRKTAKPRLYLVPKKLRNCRGDNIVAVEAKSLVGRRLGPFGGNIMLGAWWELEQKADMMQEYLLLFREIGFLILAISLVLMALFEKYSQNQLQIAFVSFSFWAGLMCVSLSGWLFTFTNHPQILYQVHAVLVCVMLVEFIRMLALYTRTPYMSGLSHWWSGLGSAAVFYVLFLSTGWVALIPFYKLILLGFVSLAALLFVSGLARKSFAGSGLQRILLFMILIGVASDTARIWGVHSGPNISAYLIGVAILGIGLSLASDLVAVFKMADDARRLRQEKNRQEIFNNIAHQVAHDIRSPLAALDAALKNTGQMPEEQRIMVRHAVNRIRDIATNLIEKSRQRLGTDPVSGNAAGIRQDLGEPVQTCLLSSLIDPVVTEKRLQFKSRPGINIDFELTLRSYGLFAKIQPVEFQRLVSNLINNAVEALGEKGAVNLWLNSENGNVVFTISDNGKGVTPEILARLGQKGETHGKVGGSGLGLFHAKTAAANWGGSLEMASEPGKGTTVKIKLPSAEVLEDFMLELPLAAGWPVVVLDDDASIHQVWKGRFEYFLKACPVLFPFPFSPR